MSAEGFAHALLPAWLHLCSLARLVGGSHIILNIQALSDPPFCVRTTLEVLSRSTGVARTVVSRVIVAEVE